MGRRRLFVPRLMIVAGLLASVLAISPARAQGTGLELIASFYDQLPTGVTVTQDQRIFVSFPRWEDPVAYTVGEVIDGATVRPYPNAAINQFDPANPGGTLINVQSVVVDPANRLWLLDTGSINFGPVVPGGAKLVGIDLATNQITKTIQFSADVVLATSYINDVRFDLRRGVAGTAFITDSSGTGPNALIVVDLATGQSQRRLNKHPSTSGEYGFLPIVEGRAITQDPADGPPRPISIGADGIAISADGARLFYTPLASRRLYSVDAAALADPNVPDYLVAQTIVDHGEKGASDGLETDAAGRIYTTNFEHNAILRRLPNGLYQTVVQDPRLIWPDSLSIATNNYIYVTSSQLHRQPSYQNGVDLRQKPYNLFRIKIDAGPVLLK